MERMRKLFNAHDTAFLTIFMQKQINFIVPTYWAEIIVNDKFNTSLTEFLECYTFIDSWIIYKEATNCKIISRQYVSSNKVKLYSVK